MDFLGYDLAEMFKLLYYEILCMQICNDRGERETKCAVFGCKYAGIQNLDFKLRHLYIHN